LVLLVKIKTYEMDSKVLHLSIDYVGGCGVILSPEQKASLQTSLVIQLNNQKFSRVQYWGKILGIQADYYIAQGFTSDHFSERKCLYSKDCIRWALLNPATPETLSKARLIRGRFTGDPSYHAEHVTRVESSDGELTEQIITLKEEERLAAVVAQIDQDVMVVPRGAYVKSSTGDVHTSRHFEGPSPLEAIRLSNYQHFRKAERLYDKTMIERADLDPTIDFMDSIENDVPRGSWSVQQERGSGLVSIKSLLWPGYFFYHVPDTRQYGSVYVGTGEKNIDLPFML